MRINTNISSLGAQEAAKNTNNSIASSLEKLSTGLRINKASDDASGLAIADKLRTQVTSINQGISNGNSAIALLQIADKSMGEQSKILDTIKSKSIQANTDTTSADGRESIRKDISKLLNQLDNIAKQTNYNGTKLLEGANQGRSAGLNFQIGETEADIISNTAIQSNTAGLGGGGKAIPTGTNIVAGAAIQVKDSVAAGQSIVISGSKVDVIDPVTGAITQGVKDEATKAELNGVVGSITATAAVVTITSTDEATKNALDLLVAGDSTSATITKNAATGEYTLKAGASIDLGELNANLTVNQAGDAANSITISTKETVSIKNTDPSKELDITGTNLVGGETLATLKNLGANELTAKVASKFQDVINNSITELNGYRGDIGSTQNQVESAVRNLMTQATNLKAAESIIRDVDYAEESANFNKLNIISQAGSYAISQSNATQQNVLRLLQ